MGSFHKQVLFWEWKVNIARMVQTKYRKNKISNTTNSLLFGRASYTSPTCKQRSLLCRVTPVSICRGRSVEKDTNTRKKTESLETILLVDQLLVSNHKTRKFYCIGQNCMMGLFIWKEK